MNFNDFVLKYPEVVRQIQNKVFPCYYNNDNTEIRLKDCRSYVKYLIEIGETPLIDMNAVKDSFKLYDIDNKLFEDYKFIEEDMANLLLNINKEKERI